MLFHNSAYILYVTDTVKSFYAKSLKSLPKGVPTVDRQDRFNYARRRSINSVPTHLYTEIRILL